MFDLRTVTWHQKYLEPDRLKINIPFFNKSQSNFELLLFKLFDFSPIFRPKQLCFPPPLCSGRIAKQTKKNVLKIVRSFQPNQSDLATLTQTLTECFHLCVWCVFVCLCVCVCVGVGGFTYVCQQRLVISKLNLDIIMCVQ